jgi:hypothetical protein
MCRLDLAARAPVHWAVERPGLLGNGKTDSPLGNALGGEVQNRNDLDTAFKALRLDTGMIGQFAPLILQYLGQQGIAGSLQNLGICGQRRRRWPSHRSNRPTRPLWERVYPRRRRCIHLAFAGEPAPTGAMFLQTASVKSTRRTGLRKPAVSAYR